MTQVLENLVGSMPSSMSSMYNTIDQYAVGTAVLYSSGVQGLQDSKSFQYGYSLGGGLKIDFYGYDKTNLTHGHVKNQLTGEVLKEYTGYECSMLDPLFKKEFKKFP